MTHPDDQVVKLTRPTDFDVLEVFSDGEQNLARNVSKSLERDRPYINTRLSHLEGSNLLERIGPAENSGLYRITERGVAAFALRDQYDSGREWEQLVDERAEEIEIVRPQLIDHADD
jgi:hypothetical protein